MHQNVKKVVMVTEEMSARLAQCVELGYAVTESELMRRCISEGLPSLEQLEIQKKERRK